VETVSKAPVEHILIHVDGVGPGEYPICDAVKGVSKFRMPSHSKSVPGRFQGRSYMRVGVDEISGLAIFSEMS
jgi:hypothetical protein